MAISLIIFSASLVTVLFICNTEFMREKCEKFERFITFIIDKINIF